MFSPMVNPTTLLILHEAREHELFAKARESSLLEAAKNARTYKAVEPNRSSLRHGFAARILDLLVSFGL